MGVGIEQAWPIGRKQSTSRLREQFGFVEPVARDEGLRRTVEWERAHPPSEFQPEQFDYSAEDVALALLRSQSGLGVRNEPANSPTKFCH